MFTIAIPTHNRRETTVLAVRSALAQELPPQQVIVLCDGCTDGTAEAVTALGDERVDALELEKGPGYAYDHRNRALELAGTPFIVYLADDDLLLPDHLARVAERVDGADVVCSPAVTVMPDDTLWWGGADWSIDNARRRLDGRANSNCMASVAVSIAAARAAGGWDGTLERRADWDLWQRVMRSGATATATEVPTVLHFQATGRVQDWDARVVQNRRWSEALGDPAALAALRPRLARTRYEYEAQLLADLDARTEELEQVRQSHAEQYEAWVAATAEREQALTDTQRESEDRRLWVNRSEELLESQRHHIAALEREVAQLRKSPSP